MITTSDSSVEVISGKTATYKTYIYLDYASLCSGEECFETSVKCSNNG